jgi:conjugation system TraG family ATPase
MNQDYDRFLTLSDAATSLMYKERAQRSEDTPLKIYYTDRQGIPIAIDISGKEGRNKLTDNSNFFCLGPSGSGKSFSINTIVRQMHEQGTDIVMVDTGNSYEGLCEYLGGKYISYTEEKPITMNPFKITKEELNIEKVNFLKNLILQIWKGSNGVVSKTEDRLIAQVIDEYYANYFAGKIDTQLSFNSFFEYSIIRVPEIIKENELHGIDVADLNYQLRDFYRGGSHETTLNENMDSTLFDETFIVFEIDAIKDDPTLFPIVTLIIMDVFLQKMRLKKNRKVLVIEEAWKAIATPLMAEYIKYLYKTARKFWASVGVVTQEIQDIIGSEIVKEAIINNSDVVMLLDQSKFRERFDNIKAILGLTDVDCKKIFTINRLENKDGRSFFREVFIRRGSTSGVYGVEEPRECYMTYTTERAEKEALKLYKSELNCSHQQAIEAYCRDWALSGIAKSLEFAQKVNKAGCVLNLKA